MDDMIETAAHQLLAALDEAARRATVKRWAAAFAESYLETWPDRGDDQTAADTLAFSNKIVNRAMALAAESGGQIGHA